MDAPNYSCGKISDMLGDDTMLLPDHKCKTISKD